MLEAQSRTQFQQRKIMRMSTKNCLEDAITVRVLQCLDLSLAALHAFFVAHTRIRDASRKKLLPLLRLGIEEALLRLNLLELGSDLFSGRSQIIRRRRQSRRLRADADLCFALVVNELLLLRRLQLLRVRDGPLEVTQDHLHHPNDPCRRALGSGVCSVEASVGSIILDRGLLLNETLFDGRLRSLAVEVAQNLKRLLDGAHALFRFSNGLLVLLLLLSTRLRLVGVIVTERFDCFLQLGLREGELLLA